MKQKGGVRFSADFAENLPANAVVKIAFHENADPDPLTKHHTNNIAR